MDGEPATKKRRTTPEVSQGEPATLAGEPTADTLISAGNNESASAAALANAEGGETQATVNGDANGSALQTPLDTVPDEEHAAPPSSAAGAHAKPLSALFKAKTPSPKKKRTATKPLTRVGSNWNNGDENKENFTELLARLNQDSA